MIRFDMGSEAMEHLGAAIGDAEHEVFRASGAAGGVAIADVHIRHNGIRAVRSDRRP